MHFSRAVAFAAFTALKWLSIVASVLFAALAVRFHFDGAGLQSILGSLATAAGCVAASYVLHLLAQRIAP